MKILSADQMRALDDRAIRECGVPSIVLMENASRGAAGQFSRRFPPEKFKRVVVVVGKGNNGGDGIAVGRILWQKGYGVEFLFLAPPDGFNPDPLVNFRIVESLDLPRKVIGSPEELDEILSGYHPSDTFLVDAIFGTGLTQPVKKGTYASAIRSINGCGLPVAAIDVPSGLSELFLPEEGEHVAADFTVTFQCLKLSHIYPDGNLCCGEIMICDIGIPRSLMENPEYDTALISPRDFSGLLAKRERFSHKGDYGHCLNISGSLEKPGAGILSSFAMLRAGAGLSTLAVSPENRTLAIQSHPELMVLIFKNTGDILERLSEFNTVLLGPGMGNTNETYDTVTKIIQYAEHPVILDADALNVFQRGKEFFKAERKIPVIITPHPGEFSRLTGQSVAEVQRNRIRLSREFAREYNLYVVLKGHHTIIATPEGQVAVNQTGNPGMATAGSGDVLSGLTAGLIARFYPKFSLEPILKAAVFVHGHAGDLAAAELGEAGLTAGDILKFFPLAWERCDGFKTRFPYSG